MHDEIIVYQDDPTENNTQLQQPDKPDRNIRTWVKRIVILIVLAVLAVAAFVLFNLFKVSVSPFSFGHLKGESEGRVNIMLLGVGDPGHDAAALSDTNIILSVDTKNHQAAIIGIPRDLRVRIPGFGYGKINNANAQGGIPVAKQVYENTFDVPIHYYVKANFTGLKQVVDAVGGVDVKNAYQLSDPQYPCDKNQYRSCGFKLAAGDHHLNGTDALKFVRCRKGTCGDDFGRAERQQQVLQSIRSEATSAGTIANPVALGKLITAAGDNIDTDLSVNNMLRLNDLTKPQKDKQGKSLPTKIFNIVLSLNPDGFLIQSPTSSDLLPDGGDFTAIQQFIQGIFKFGPIWTEHPTVMIENGTTTPGIAAKLEKQITSDGYSVNVVATTNALKRDYPTTQIIDHTLGKRPYTAAYFTSLLKVPVSQPATALKTPPADIEIILGADYAAQQPAQPDSSDDNASQ